MTANQNELLEQEETVSETDIAIIGMAGRFPGAQDVEAFWKNIRDGVESIRQFSDEELQAAGVDEQTLQHPNYVKASPVLDGVELFDAPFFGYNPREAEMLDPQQRLFLECAWTALEHAGYDPETYTGLIGVYGGVGVNHYAYDNLRSNPGLIAKVGEFQTMIGNDKDFLTTRVSYKLNLKGPSVGVQTACSTSLVAIHQACQSLLNRECDMSLAGGVSIMGNNGKGYFYQEGSIVSPDGHCRAFDEEAQGVVFGSGTGIVVLKRLQDALDDGDHIAAVIKGSAINNDGASKIGFTAPSVEGQMQVIAEALALAGLEASDLSYVETHGTGTALGDRIEIMSLQKVFEEATDEKNVCAIGSVKTNVGHLDMAAGVTGVIKTVQALKHKQLPPSLHFKRPNPVLGLEDSPFYVNQSLQDWAAPDDVRRAGVSSFGVGGTNAHVILEEAPEHPSGPSDKPWHVLLLSAKSEEALERQHANLLQHLLEHPELNIADAAYTLQVGRRAFSYRQALVCQSVEDGVQRLQSGDEKHILRGCSEHGETPVVLMFPGQGAQYVNMGLGLYRTEPVFRETLDACAELVTPHLGFDFRTLLYPEPGEEQSAAERLSQTAVTQPVLFAVEYAQAKLLLSHGVTPHALVGHSLGEYVAACLAGVFSLEDALLLVTARGKLIQSLPHGAMTAVPLAEADVLPLLGSRLFLAAVNAPQMTVVSGPQDAIEAFEAELAARGFEGRRLQTSHAFHSGMIDPVLGAFEDLVRKTKRSAPQMPVLSNVTGTWLTAEEAVDPRYWVKHMRQAVRFADNVQELLAQEVILLECGPGRTLSMLAKKQEGAEQNVLITMRHPLDHVQDDQFYAETLGKLWLAGAALDLSAWYAGEDRRRTPLPTYPFEPIRCWVEPGQAAGNALDTNVKKGLPDWFHLPVWKQAPLLPHAGGEADARPVLLLSRAGAFGTALTETLQGMGRRVISSAARDKAGFQTLFQELKEGGRLPGTIVHLLALEGSDELAETEHLAFYSLLELAQTLGDLGLTDHPMELKVLLSGSQNVLGDEATDPLLALAAGPCRVIPQEYPHVSATLIDLAGVARNGHSSRLLLQVANEILSPSADAAVALRGNRRYIRTFDGVQLPEPSNKELLLRPQGVYLITGGLGGIGLGIAEHLAQAVQAKLVLLGRTLLPPRDEWDAWLTSHDAEDRTSRRIEQVRRLEALGSEVLLVAADVTDPDQVQAAVDTARREFGAVHGVIHAAGVPGAGLIQLKSKEQAADVLAPKVRGTLALEQALRAEPFDFLLLFSSITALSGGVGQVDYTAANAFLAAYAQSEPDVGGAQVITVDWGPWQWDDWEWRLTSSMQEVQGYLKQQREEFGISFAEGFDALQRILAAGQPQVHVATRDLNWLLDLYGGSTGDRVLQELEQMSKRRVNAPSKRKYEAPEGEAELIIAEVWQDLLGVEQVGRRDNFFDLGGHSLLAVQIVSRLREKFQIELSMNKLFENPTVAELSAVITAAQVESIGLDEMERLLLEIEQMNS